MLLNWTSDHVFDTLLILGTGAFLVWLVRAELEMRRFRDWLANPRNEYCQILYAAAKVELPPPDPTICTCRCVDHGYLSGGMHFAPCCIPCLTCNARIAQGRIDEHKRFAHQPSA